MASRECRIGDWCYGINAERGYIYERYDLSILGFIEKNKQIVTKNQIINELRNEEEVEYTIAEDYGSEQKVSDLIIRFEKIQATGEIAFNQQEIELINSLKSFKTIQIGEIVDYASIIIPEQYKNQAIELEDYRRYVITDKCLEHVLTKTGVVASLVHGEAGTGKTSQVKAICARYNIPCFQMQLNEQSLPSDLLSEFIPNTEDNSSTIKLKKSQFTLAFQYGGVCLIDEMNMASPGSLAALNSALDDSKQIIMANGEVIRRHPKFRLVATANLGYTGTYEFNDATLNRFLILPNYVLTKTAFKKIMKSKALTTELTNFFWELLTKVKTYIKANEIPAIVSVRNIEQYIELKGLGIEQAYSLAFVEPVNLKADKNVEADLHRILKQVRDIDDSQDVFTEDTQSS